MGGLKLTDYSYWIAENGTKTVWVKVDSIGASSIKTIYLIKETGYTPSGSDVFDYFNDFTGTITDDFNTTGATWSYDTNRLKKVTEIGRASCRERV